MIKNKYVALVLFVILVVAIWNVAQYIWHDLVSKDVWTFAVGYDVIRPGVVGAAVGYVLFILPDKVKK